MKKTKLTTADLRMLSSSPTTLIPAGLPKEKKETIIDALESYETIDSLLDDIFGSTSYEDEEWDEFFYDENMVYPLVEKLDSIDPCLAEIKDNLQSFLETNYPQLELWANFQGIPSMKSNEE